MVRDLPTLVQNFQVQAQTEQYPWAHVRDSQAQWKSWLAVAREGSEDSKKWIK